MYHPLDAGGAGAVAGKNQWLVVSGQLSVANGN
jgi:hypothetical protein